MHRVPTTSEQRLTAREVAADPRRSFAVPARELLLGRCAAGDVLAMQAIAGNAAVARLLAPARVLQRELAVKRDGLDERVYAEEKERVEVEAMFEAIRRIPGVVVDSKRVAEITRKKWQQQGTPPKATEGAELEKVQPDAWYIPELAGLRDALTIAGGVKGFVQSMPLAKAQVIYEDATWIFGKTTGTIASNRFAAPGQERDEGGGETIEPQGQPKTFSIAMTGGCMFSVFELEPKPEGRQEPAQESAREQRVARGIFIHEIGHTIYKRFMAAEWMTFKKHGPGGQENAPTKYGRDSPKVEEDFADSFMMYVLYREQLRNRAPARLKFFEERGHLLKLAAV